MKIITQIARSELRQFFYSPLAWTVLIALYVASVITYFQVETAFITNFLRGGYYVKMLEFLTNRITEQLFESHPLRQIIIDYVYLFLPLVTMGVFAREFRNGTDKLLFSAPVSTRQLVFGKFLGLLVFNGFVVLVVGLVFGIIGVSVSHADWGLLASTLLGFYLLVMLLAAIGLYISSLTSYPVVAGLVTLVSFGLLFNYLSTFLEFIGKHMGLADGNLMVKFAYVMDYIRIQDYQHGKLYNFTRGVLHSRDVLYFVNLSAVFVALTLMRLKGKRQWVSPAKRMAFIGVVFGGAALIGYLSGNPYLTVVRDITREKAHTLHPTTQAILRGMEHGPIEITYYVNVFDKEGEWYFHPFRQYGLDKHWEPYRRYKPDINIQYVYYYDHRGGEPQLLTLHSGQSERDVAETYARTSAIAPLPLGYFRTPEQLAEMEDLSFEQYRNVAKLTYNGKSTFLRNFPVPPNAPGTPYLPTETEVSPVLSRLIGGQPRVLFTAGHAELDPDGLGTRGLKNLLNNPILKYSMINQGLDSDTIDLGRSDLSDTDRFLAICDPRFQLSEGFIERFENCLADGKNFLIMLEPDSREVIGPLLERLGIGVRPGVLAYENERYTSEQVRAYLAHPAKAFSKSMKQYLEKEAFYRSDSIWVSINGAVALDQVRDVGFRVEPFLILDTVSGFNRPSAFMQSDVEGKLTRNASDEIAPFALAYKLTRQVNGREQRIIVVGDADPQSELFSTGFAANLFGWLSDSGFPVDLVKPEPLDKTFKTGTGNIRTRKAIWIYGVTGLLVLLASVVLIRRNRK